MENVYIHMEVLDELFLAHLCIDHHSWILIVNLYPLPLENKCNDFKFKNLQKLSIGHTFSCTHGSSIPFCKNTPTNISYIMAIKGHLICRTYRTRMLNVLKYFSNFSVQFCTNQFHFYQSLHHRISVPNVDCFRWICQLKSPTLMFVVVTNWTEKFIFHLSTVA